MDFPYRGVRQNRKELDLADADASEDDIYPSLNDITLESVPAVRNLISDLAMDVLLYQSAYCEHIAGIVQQECNRILRLFKARNPSFKGSVSLCGHSLGSAILFDILCHQPDQLKPPRLENIEAHKGTSQPSSQVHPLDFDCEELFCLGSPIALFQMLKGKTIAGRDTMNIKGLRGSFDTESNPKVSNPSFASSGPFVRPSTPDELSERSTIVSSPKCRQLYNIFHPSDPVSYRIEPLISSAMSTLKPQPLPSVKRSLWTASGQSLSIIGSRVGQSVGSLWSNFTSGVASSVLNRSLGLSSEKASTSTGVNATAQAQSSPATNSSNPNANVDSLHKYEGRPRTLIERDLETLYGGFQKAKNDRKEYLPHFSAGNDADDCPGTEKHIRDLKNEDAKVRALNANGRVDYSVQE